MAFDVDAVRTQFPILRRRVATLDGERPLVYLDHGASTHAPRPVLDAVTDLMEHRYANVHRGNHTLSQESSDLFDDASRTLSSFIRADPDHSALVLTHNTTAALDLAAHIMKDVPGATLATRIEHHSNDLVHRRAGPVEYADADPDGRLIMEQVQERLEAGGIKLVAVTGASNVTGEMPRIHQIARLAHENGARILVDAAQLYAHAPIDVKPPSHPEHIDFLAAAGHKAYAPFGSAFLHGPRDLMDASSPHIPGGGTVDWVTDEGALHVRGPDRHMGGTPNIVGAVAFAAATRFLAGIGMDSVQEHEQELTRHAIKGFQELEATGRVRLLGPRDATDRLGVFTFTVEGVRHEKVSAVLDHEHAVATRNGCFCAHPLLHRLLRLGDTTYWTAALERGEKVDLPGAVRAAVGIYNTPEDLDRLFAGIEAIASGRIRGTYETPEPMVCRPVPVASPQQVK